MSFLPPDFPDYGKIFAETGFDVFQQIINVNKFVIELIDAGLLYGFDSDDFGFSIIIFTFITKAFLYPLYFGQTKASARTMQLQPKIRAIRERYASDKEKI